MLFRDSTVSRRHFEVIMFCCHKLLKICSFMHILSACILDHCDFFMRHAVDALVCVYLPT